MRRLVLLALLTLLAGPAYPCSTFALARGGQAVFGRNYDFEIGNGFVMTNLRGARKQGYLGTTSWTARYGSVTFNQFGKGFPMDGMNDAGLVVALMWLDGTEYPAADARPALTVLEWIQYQLDNYATVAEVLENAEKVRIIRNGTPLHYLIADRGGASATIEYLGGQLVVHTGATLPTANLTNDRYDDSVRDLNRRRTIPGGADSLARFSRTAMLMRQVDENRPLVGQAFDILRSVAQPGWTRWSVVYDMTAGRVHWTTLTNSVQRSISFDELDLGCTATPKMINVDGQAIEAYSSAVNLDLIARSYAGTSFLRNASRESIERDARYSESWSCSAQKRRSARP
ncbi:MAG TPA: linear amide C-N hydrolase [Thermoanaerobaculia bacterium]|nr:linear amide C-N hydrolase [Thermoanaerobaculia bacterium]